MSRAGALEAGPFQGDAATRVDLVMTTYRAAAGRQDLLVETLRSLAAQTDVAARLWLMDEGVGPPLPDLRGILAGSKVELAGVFQSGDRIGQAAQFNRAFALIEDDLRQTRWAYRTYLVKTEDDFEFSPGWLQTLISVWQAPEFAGHNIGMLGGANGEGGPLVKIGGHDVRLTIHVAAGCMFAPLAMWRQYLPVPVRANDVRGGSPPGASCLDWHVTRRGLNSVLALGKCCGLLDGLIKHRGEGSSTWKA